MSGRIGPPPSEVILTFPSSIYDQYGDIIYDVSWWNLNFDLPNKGEPFKIVSISDNIVSLKGGYNIALINIGLDLVEISDNYSITSIEDGAFVSKGTLVTVSLPSVITAGLQSFSDCNVLTLVSLPLCTTIGWSCFYGCTSLTSISLPLCTDLGGTPQDDGVFVNITGNTISFTANNSLKTNNPGENTWPAWPDSDGDIQYLGTNNTVTMTWI
jgi:hypothetical protein